jgi:hypothetical protein
MIRALASISVLGAALLVAGHARADSYNCYFKDDVSACEADGGVAKLPGPESSAAQPAERSLCDIPGWGCENSKFIAPNDTYTIAGRPHYLDDKDEITATKGDIDAINKKLDEIKHILICLDDAVRPSKWTAEPCQ